MFHCPQDLISRVDKIATHVGITRSEAIRTMLETCVEGYEPLMKVGILRKMVAKKEQLKKKMIDAMQPSML